MKLWANGGRELESEPKGTGQNHHWLHVCISHILTSTGGGSPK